MLHVLYLKILHNFGHNLYLFFIILVAGMVWSQVTLFLSAGKLKCFSNTYVLDLITGKTRDMIYYVP